MQINTVKSVFNDPAQSIYMKTDFSLIPKQNKMTSWIISTYKPLKSQLIQSIKTSYSNFRSLSLKYKHGLSRLMPDNLTDYCAHNSQDLWSARHCQLSVPSYRCSMFGSHAFPVAGPTVWNSLPDDLRDSAVDSEHFRQVLETHLFTEHVGLVH